MIVVHHGAVGRHHASAREEGVAVRGGQHEVSQRRIEPAQGGEQRRVFWGGRRRADRFGQAEIV
jgi:hypothetical protein